MVTNIWNPTIYAIRDGVKVLTNPKLQFGSYRLESYFRWAKIHPNKQSRAYRIPCKSITGHEDTEGDFLFVWDHTPEPAET